MTLKLTYEQAHALYNLFLTEILPEVPTNIADSLYKDHMEDIFKKLRAKLEAKYQGNGYSLSLKDKEAKGFYLYFSGRSLPLKYHYEQNFIAAQLNEINRLHA